MSDSSKLSGLAIVHVFDHIAASLEMIVILSLAPMSLDIIVAFVTVDSQSAASLLIITTVPEINPTSLDIMRILSPAPISLLMITMWFTMLQLITMEDYIIPSQ